MRFGAHVPTRGSLASAVDYALSIAADAFQIFVSNPRAWAPPTLTPEAARAFRDRREEAGLGPVLVHSTYLINVASPDRGFLRRSTNLGRAEREAAEALGADGLVVHAGAGGAGERAATLERAVASVRAIAGSGQGIDVLLELTAGGAGAVASTIAQAGELLEAVDHPRVGLCLDTCHLFAAGAPLDHADGARRTLDQVEARGLVDRLRVVHANDARDPRGSRRDRHEHPGAGLIGEIGLAAFLGHPVVRRCAALVETRGGPDDHRGDVATLRRLAAV
jgi:deoxyribonuclease IV